MRDKLATVGFVSVVGVGLLALIIGLVAAWAFGVGWLAWKAYGSVAPTSWPHVGYLPMVGIVLVIGFLMRQAAK